MSSDLPTAPAFPKSKVAATDQPLLEAIAHRWSPRAFDADRPVSEEQIKSLLEAARWASSASNLQPWRLAWALRGEAAFQAILASLNPGNSVWASRAGALLVGCAVMARPDGAPNRHAAHDLGQALAQLAIQATAQGLAVHPMAGFDSEKTRQALAVPEGVEPYTAVAIGWPGNPELLSETHRTMELAVRTRIPIAEMAPRGGWRR